MAFLIRLLVLVLLPLAAHAARLKELVDVEGVRDNALFGYGLVVGLGGTGDTESSPVTAQSVAGMLGRLGVRVDPHIVRVRNVAAVMVTAKLPAFSRPGSHLDVTVSSVGNARSLEGGVLLVTPLTGADGEVHALAQGPVQVGGFDATQLGAGLRKNQPTSGRVPGGATVERAGPAVLSKGPLVLALRQPDFTTARRIAAAINTALGAGVARALDPAGVEVTSPAGSDPDPVDLVAKLEAVEVEVDHRAKVVVSERTGTVVAGEGVKLRPALVAHGGIEVSVAQTPVVAQGGLYASSTVTQQGSVGAEEHAAPSVALPAAATVQELTRALNLLGVRPRDLVSILQALSAAGALDAELEVL